MYLYSNIFIHGGVGHLMNRVDYYLYVWELLNSLEEMDVYLSEVIFTFPLCVWCMQLFSLTYDK